jgi:hypothetical protein
VATRDEVDFEKFSDEQLLDFFNLADDQGHCDYAGQALDVYFARQKTKIIHDVPAWLHWLPSVFWHQKNGS